MLIWMHHALRRLRRDRRGNMLMIFAFAIMPITFATGMGIDYVGAMRLQTRLNAITDASALAAVTAPMMKDTIDDACTAARATFESQITGMKGLAIDTRSNDGLTITITDTYQSASPTTVTCPATGKPIVPATLPLTRSTLVTYKAASANNFAAVLGRASLRIGGSATARTMVAPFIDIHMALDTSQSMGLAATDADALALWDRTIWANGPGNGCTFGCHVFQKADEDSLNVRFRRYASNEDIAEGYGIKLRINVLRDATQEMLQNAIDGQGTGNSYYRFGLYRIGASTTSYAPLTDRLADLKTQVASLKLGPNDSSGFGDTNLADMLESTYAKIVAKGDGTTRQKARAFLFIVTDGVSDVKGGGCVYSHCMATIDATKCQRYKDAGVTVGVVYTTYLPVKSNPRARPGDSDYNALRHEYTDLVLPIADKIRPSLQGCASPGWFFEASDGPTIHAAMQNLFQQATQTPSIIR